MQNKSLWLLLVVCLSVVVAPVVGPGAAAVDNRFPEETPRNCIETPPRSVNPASAAITGVVSRTDRNITIEYSTAKTNYSGSNLQVSLPYGANLHSSTGFTSSLFGDGLYWENNSSSHSITYEMEPSSIGVHQVEYPSGDNWIIAGSPDHFNTQVHLQPVGEGYIGGKTLYLGDYSVQRARVGCQEFVAVVPEAARFTGVESRLQELNTAAKALPVGHQYRTVRIFVSPEKPGDAAGFVMHNQNEIVVVDQAPGMKSSVLWIHEYVHTLQGFDTQPELAWIYEGSATYLSLRVAVENEFISPRTYDYLLNQGSRDFEVSMTQSTQERVAYERGAILLAILDRELADTHGTTVVKLISKLNRVRNPGIDDVVRWLRDDVGMDADDANHTLRLVRDDDVLHPPLLVTESNTPQNPQLVLYYLSLWETRWLFGFMAIVLSGRISYDYIVFLRKYE